MLCRISKQIYCIVKKKYIALVRTMSSVKGMLVPNYITAESYWLSCIIVKQGGIEIINLTNPVCKTTRLEDISQLLTAEWEKLKINYKKFDVIPIWCIEYLNPCPYGIKSFFTPFLPKSFSAQISSIGLANPIDIRLTTKNKYSIVKSIIDFDVKRIVLLGNPRLLITAFEIILARFNFHSLNLIQIIDRLKNLLVSNAITPVGTSIFIGGLGSLFIFVSSLLFTKLLSIGGVSIAFYFIIILLMLAYIY